MDNLQYWARRHCITPRAIRELLAMFNIPANDVPPVKGTSEQAVKAAVRLEAAGKGLRLWVNNVGAFKDERGVPVRYGLANESKQVNSILKSSDLIGIRPLLIDSGHVGCVIGQFVARECKEPNWQYKGNPHEEAQLNFLQLVTALGGDAQFCNGTGSI